MTGTPHVLPDRMSAVRFTRFGAPADALVVDQVALPPVAAAESLVHVNAVGVNPSDVAMVAGRFGSELPAIPGRDFAGVVVSGPRAGEEVWGSGQGFGVTRPGADAEYVAVPDAWLSRKPARLSMREAASVTLSYCTAWWAVQKTGGLRVGQTLLILGGAGMVGQAATDIATWKGAEVIVADRHPPSSPVPFVSTEQGGFERSVRDMTDSRGVDVVLDMVGGPLVARAMTALRDGGHYVLMASPGGAEATLDASAFYRRRLRLSGVNMASVSGVEIRDILDALAPGFEAGFLTPPVARALPLTQARDAYEAVAAGTHGVKQVLYPGTADQNDDLVMNEVKGTL